MRKWCGFPPKVSQTEFWNYCETYSSLPFLREEKPKNSFLDAWKGERTNFESQKRIRHETI
jgi:hypothetical protein